MQMQYCLSQALVLILKSNPNQNYNNSIQVPKHVVKTNASVKGRLETWSVARYSSPHIRCAMSPASAPFITVRPSRMLARLTHCAPAAKTNSKCYPHAQIVNLRIAHPFNTYNS